MIPDSWVRSRDFVAPPTKSRIKFTNQWNPETHGM